jgi:hypothetical protein
MAGLAESSNVQLDRPILPPTRLSRVCYRITATKGRQSGDFSLGLAMDVCHFSI